ncbi:putative nicotinate-nucleotide adenylyltransferase [Hyella patelloides LEGE 07179]|uniref:nicotinate-nucleotide adenylyltransferase n=1 Tax=Hyella patelloides LEGE 07179 TaxID=945734 RepID=A0A563VZN1_9CYAN|nr:nicotinate-nucleotide adenylyltransferase [Hyella patelloides]VEP16827.1 putative nicotinate-nucleotide adenylyltransferase [Hyella patelloides LEGE 07179]
MNNISSSSKIALFGTSADPPTAGHQTILRWLSQHYDLIVVWASDNPFKAHQTNLHNRSEMLKLTIQEIEPLKNNITLCQSISDRRTLITVQKAQQIWGDAEFTLVIGADLVKQIITWYQIEKLLKQVKILVIPRSAYTIEKSDLANLQALGGQYTIATLNAPRVSSSRYRLRGDTTVITAAVENYIQQKKLYSDIATTK